jgi:ADP-heptose:LPS heptosyltransferase
VAILGTSHIGDVLYRTPSLAPLRAALPDARITYICEPGSAEVLETNPDIDEVLPISDDTAWWRSPRARSILREQRFDAALCSNHIAYHDDLLLATTLGIPNRVAFSHRGLTGLATISVAPEYPSPAPAYFRAMVAAITGRAPDWSLEPVLHLTPEDHAEAEAATRELGLDTEQPVIACTLTHRQRKTAAWAPSAYLSALAVVAQSRPFQVVLCGSRADAAVLEQVAATAPMRCRVLAGRLGLRAFGAFLTRCDALLATDSGPRHIANAVGTPVVFVRSLSVSRVEAGHYSANEVDMAPAAEWLSLRDQEAALSRLAPERVAAVLLDTLTTHTRRGVA